MPFGVLHWVDPNLYFALAFFNLWLFYNMYLKHNILLSSNSVKFLASNRKAVVCINHDTFHSVDAKTVAEGGHEDASHNH